MHKIESYNAKVVKETYTILHLMTSIDEFLPISTIIFVKASFGTSSSDVLGCDLVAIILEVDATIDLCYLIGMKIVKL